MPVPRFFEDGHRAKPGAVCSIGTTSVSKKSESRSGRRRLRVFSLYDGSWWSCSKRYAVVALIDALAAATGHWRDPFEERIRLRAITRQARPRERGVGKVVAAMAPSIGLRFPYSASKETIFSS